MIKMGYVVLEVEVFFLFIEHWDKHVHGPHTAPGTDHSESRILSAGAIKTDTQTCYRNRQIASQI